MVDWEREFSNLTPSIRSFYRRQYNAAQTSKARKQVLKNAREGTLRFPNSNDANTATSTLQENRRRKTAQERRTKLVATARRTANTVKRAARVVRARMPNSKEIFELSSRVGQSISESTTGLMLFAEILMLIFTLKGNVSKEVNKVVGKVFLPLNVSKEGILDRLERMYSQSPEDLGLIVAANAWLSSEKGTSIAALQFATLLTAGIVAHLLTIAEKKGIMKIPRVFDVFITLFKRAGFTGTGLAIETVFYSVIKGALVWHGKLLAAKGINTAISKQSRNWLRLPMKIGWRRISQYLTDDMSRRAIEVLLTSIMDMKYAPKSVVRQAAEALKVVKRSEPTLSLPQPRTPSASRNNKQQVAESPLRPRPRPTRRVTTIVNMPIRAMGSNGTLYNFTQNEWNGMNNRNRGSPTNDPVVRLTYGREVRYARRSEL
jgi:hypothetical protein